MWSVVWNWECGRCIVVSQMLCGKLGAECDGEWVFWIVVSKLLGVVRGVQYGVQDIVS